MSKVYRPDKLMRGLRAKVMGLLKAESTFSKEERQSQQWQLFLNIDKVGSFIVGKGGINTMFYSVNGGERKLCLPKDMVDIIDKWIVKLSVVTYSVRRDGKTIKSNLTLDEAKKVKCKAGSYICEVRAGKRKKILVLTKALMGNEWKAYR